MLVVVACYAILGVCQHTYMFAVLQDALTCYMNHSAVQQHPCPPKLLVALACVPWDVTAASGPRNHETSVQFNAHVAAEIRQHIYW
jgi:hypothetical protein